ncbi:MAG: maleylpyruvate isomerase N-terminal domain-containing protein [Anaerolineae bacterium]
MTYAYLDSLTDEQLTQPTDPAGWTAKDHVAHLAIWEDSVNALFDGIPRWQHMGIDRDLWETTDWDQINAVIQQRYHAITCADLDAMWNAIHARSLAGRSVQRRGLAAPLPLLPAGSTWDLPAIHWVIIDTFLHYDEHKGYIAVIVERGGSQTARQP